MFNTSSFTLSHLSSVAQSYITDNPLYQNPNIRLALFTLGAGFALSSLFSLTKSVLSLCHTSKDLALRYGRGTWAVITGASDGIGKAYAFELASRGFNIVLVSRSKDKLEKVARDIKLRYPLIQTRIIVEDFAHSADEGFAEKIYNQAKDLDVSMLINNAGSFYNDYYVNLTFEQVRKMVLTNCLSHALITRAFLPQLAARTQKSAIISTSSIAAAVPTPYAQAYSASKTFIDYLTQGLAYEHKNIDFLSLKPGAIKTKMIKKVNAAEIEMITPEKLVKAALDELGSTTSTYGHWKHRIVGWGSKMSPPFLVEANARRNFLP